MITEQDSVNRFLILQQIAKMLSAWNFDSLKNLISNKTELQKIILFNGMRL
jgi:hypothetical protein